MNGSFKRFLWGLYAKVYDTVMLHLRPYRRLIVSVAEALNPQRGWHVLDAGCGTGNFLLNLIHACPDLEAVGVDFSPAMLKRARHKYEKISTNNIGKWKVFKEADLNTSLPFGNEEFEGVICVNVLYAVDNPQDLLEEMHRVLRKGGQLILITPPSRPRMWPVFREHVRHLQKSAPLGWVFMLVWQIIYLIPSLILFLSINIFIQRHRDFHFYTSEELALLLKKCGFELILMKRVYGGQDWFLQAIKPALVVA